ncbi:MAG: TetR family transcriptional regulator [Labilithrix sp.]|nr:TetR family transcriptional regulator [Labilithrix sp.]
MRQEPTQPKPNDDRRRSAKWEQRRKAIVDESARVFARRGYHATGIVELCEANQIGKGALYHYIGSKEQLLVAIHDRVMDEVMLGADRVAREGGTPPEQLARLGEELLDVIGRYPDHVWAFLHEFRALTGSNAEVFRRRRREYERRVQAVFDEGTKSRHFRRINSRTATMAWLGMHNYTYLWLRAGGRLSVKQLAAFYADVFVHGVTGEAMTALVTNGSGGKAAQSGSRRRR